MHKKSVFFVTIFTFLFSIPGCSVFSMKKTEEISNSQISQISQISHISHSVKTHNQINHIKESELPVLSTLEKLHLQHDEWKGTPYLLGGLDKDGVDCSGFIYLTFRDRLNINLPRTTRQQAIKGERIDKSSLRTGDLVFFKTGKKKINHVGIYLDNGKFLHASTSKGVIISNLDGLYWTDTYWQARRISS